MKIFHLLNCTFAVLTLLAFGGCASETGQTTTTTTTTQSSAAMATPPPSQAVRDMRTMPSMRGGY